MLSRDNLEKFTKLQQTSVQNVVREYCQHLFLSFLYQNSGSEKLLFKGGTALRIILKSPRFSEDLDFTGVNVTHREIEEVFTGTRSYNSCPIKIFIFPTQKITLKNSFIIMMVTGDFTHFRPLGIIPKRVLKNSVS